VGQRQTEDILVEVPRFFGVTASPGKMVQPLDAEGVHFHRLLQLVSEFDGLICELPDQFWLPA
jgi:hypothetical protein